MKKSKYIIKKVETEAEMKEFLKLFDYWHKQGLVGFVPIFILHRHKEKGELFILKDGDKVIGISWIISRKRPYEFYQVKTLAISPEYHEKGLGELFLRSLIDSLHENGSDLITSVVSGNLPAINLYKKVGFNTYDTKKTSKGVQTSEMVYPGGKT